MSGKAPFSFKWFKNGKLLQEEGLSNTHRKVSNLIIDPILETSGGNYTCVVSNADGKDNFSATLTIKGMLK